MGNMQGWKNQAKCRELLPEEIDEIFFPGPGRSATNKAEKYCADCPAIIDCLNYAILYDEEGNWGGTNRQERKVLSPVLKPMLKAAALAQGLLEALPCSWLPIVVQEFVPQGSIPDQYSPNISDDIYPNTFQY